MRLEVSVKTDIKDEKVIKQMDEASKFAMRDTVVEVTNDAVRLSPWLTGNNRRSIAGEVSGMGHIAGEGRSERIVNEGGIEGAVYSTSGYGGFL